MRFPTISSYLFAFAAACLGLASCTKNDVPDPKDIIGGGDTPGYTGLSVSDFTGKRTDGETVAECMWTCSDARVGGITAEQYIGCTITMTDEQYYTSGIDVLGQEGSWGVEDHSLSLYGNTVPCKYYVIFTNGKMRWVEITADKDDHYFEFSK